MSEVKETYAYQKIVCDGEYLAIKHVQHRIGWDWVWSYVTRIQEAWQGPLPCNTRHIKDESGYALDLTDFSRLPIRVTTTVHFELIRPEVHECSERVVSVQITEDSADALYKLLNKISISKMEDFGLSYDEACLVSRIKPYLY
jgi:hypothetical protein